MANFTQWMKAMVISGGVVIGGWALIKYITPPREKLLEVTIGCALN